MCDVIAGVAAVGVAVSAAGAVAGNQAQQKAANAQNRYNQQTATLQAGHRLEVMQYQNDVWQQDLDYARDTLAWAEDAWERQERTANRAGQAIEDNTLAATGQLLLRQVEEDMAFAMGVTEQARTGRSARATLTARNGDRGVEGNSVDAIIGDVMRQEGEVLSVMAMNRSASQRAINRQIIEADVQGDQQLANIQLKTYAPATAIRGPTPVSPVNPAATVVGPSGGVLAAQLAGAAVSGVSSYASMSGQTTKDTYGQMGAGLKKQLTI